MGLFNCFSGISSKEEKRKFERVQPPISNERINKFACRLHEVLINSPLNKDNKKTQKRISELRERILIEFFASTENYVLLEKESKEDKERMQKMQEDLKHKDNQLEELAKKAHESDLLIQSLKEQINKNQTNHDEKLEQWKNDEKQRERLTIENRNTMKDKYEEKLRVKNNEILAMRNYIDETQTTKNNELQELKHQNNHLIEELSNIYEYSRRSQAGGRLSQSHSRTHRKPISSVVRPSIEEMKNNNTQENFDASSNGSYRRHISSARHYPSNQMPDNAQEEYFDMYSKQTNETPEYAARRQYSRREMLNVDDEEDFDEHTKKNCKSLKSTHTRYPTREMTNNNAKENFDASSNEKYRRLKSSDRLYSSRGNWVPGEYLSTHPIEKYRNRSSVRTNRGTKSSARTDSTSRRDSDVVNSKVTNYGEPECYVGKTVPRKSRQYNTCLSAHQNNNVIPIKSNFKVQKRNHGSMSESRHSDIPYIARSEYFRDEYPVFQDENSFLGSSDENIYDSRHESQDEIDICDLPYPDYDGYEEEESYSLELVFSDGKDNGYDDYTN